MELDRTIPKKDVAKALELLVTLDCLKMTIQVLQKTHIGMHVNHFRKLLNSSEINSLCKKLVKKWKSMLPSSSNNDGDTKSNQENKSTNNNSNSIANAEESNSQTSTPTNNTTSIPAPNQQQSSSTTNSSSSTSINASTTNNNNTNSASSGANNNNNTDNGNGTTSSSKPTTSEGVKRPLPVQAEVPQTNSDIRLTFRRQLTDALKKPLPSSMAQEPFLEEERLAAGIEEAIYQDHRGNMDMKYKNKCRSRIANLRDDKNPYLRLNVLRGDIAPGRIAKMTADEMASDELKRQREQYTKEAINDHQMAMTGGTKTSEIKCPACKKFNTTYNQMQTRSADEPMTTFCHCNECGKRWKFC